MDASAPWGLVDVRPIVARGGWGEVAVATIAAEQEGLITIPQLRFVGLNDSAVHHRSRRGRLHRLHRGVYAVGHRNVGELGELAAAFLAVGAGSAISHRPAAVVAGILPRAAGPVDVTLPVAKGRRRSRPGIRVHETGALDRLDLVRRKGISLTALARTLIDIAEVERNALPAALNEARAQRLVTPRELDCAIRRNRGRCGAARLAALLEAEADRGFSRNRAERILGGLLNRAGLPAAMRNQSVHEIELDFYWPEQRVNVELDGFATHGRRRNFESDRDRDTFLASRGIQVLRFTWWQLTREGPKVVARTAAALALRSRIS